MIYFFSPCGTSLLTNGADTGTRNKITQYANALENEIPVVDRDVLQNIINDVRERLLHADPTVARRMSAELNGIISYYDGNLINRNDDIQFLIATDTFLGEKTAQLISEWMIRNNLNYPQVKVVEGLRTNSLNGFQVALIELIAYIEETITDFRTDPNNKVVFNLTGGFKSIQGFLQSVAHFYADESVYIFEGTQELLRIPRLPIKIDAKPIIIENLMVFRRFALQLPSTQDEIRNVPDIFLYRYADQFDISAWGKVIWDKMKNEIYGEQLHSSPSRRIRYGRSFNIDGLEERRKRMVNTQIDKLAVFAENNNQNAAGINFRRLEGNPVPGSTHEFNAWSDQDAKRFFCHYENDIIVIDSLDNALH